MRDHFLVASRVRDWGHFWVHTQDLKSTNVSVIATTLLVVVLTELAF